MMQFSTIIPKTPILLFLQLKMVVMMTMQTTHVMPMTPEIKVTLMTLIITMPPLMPMIQLMPKAQMMPMVIIMLLVIMLVTLTPQMIVMMAKDDHDLDDPEAVFLVMCDPSINEL
jgi:hypothetical protein